MTHHIKRILEEVEILESNEATKDGIANIYKRGWTKESNHQLERYLEARKRDSVSQLNEKIIMDYIIKWRNIRVIVCTMDLAILRPKLYELCNFMLVEESGQTKHLKTLMLASQMTIKTLYLVRDVE